LGQRCLKAKRLASHIWRDRRGANLIEYALLIGLVTLMILRLIIAVANWANGLWANFVL